MSIHTPLAERMRPQTLENYFGQEHLTGPGASLQRVVANGKIPSMIFWGPPGVGKTTLAHIVARSLGRPFFALSAVDAGVKEVRGIIEKAQKAIAEDGKNAVLFIDEIHRFNKAQQDSLLGAVEQGIVTLIGATTENPSFEVISPLLSRSQVFVLKELTKESLLKILDYSICNDVEMKKRSIQVTEDTALLRFSGGDARKMLNLLELVCESYPEHDLEITDAKVMSTIQEKIALYDKSGEQHYDIISAFIKSIRGSDPNAAVYWLARMIAGGEDPKFIARRMVILASEDIGNANPTALVIATNCFQAVDIIGYPECRIILAQAATYLASSPKSNASYKAIESASALVNETGDLPVPIHLRNAPTRLMKELGYGKKYEYAHSFENNFNLQEYMPDAVSGKTLYDPGKNAREKEIRDFLKLRWKEKYGY